VPKRVSLEGIEKLVRSEALEDILKTQQVKLDAVLNYEMPIEKVVDRIVEGKMEKFYEEVCLLEQHFVKDPAQTVGQVVASCIGKLGENITVRRFSRFKVGESSDRAASPA